MDIVLKYFDTVDIIVIASIFTVAVFYYFKTNSPSSKLSTSSIFNVSNSSSINISSSSVREKESSFLVRMKNEDRQILILFGSQTGTAEELAGRLAKDLAKYGKKPIVMDPEEIDAEEIQNITEINNPILILFVATYGEGDPTDNAQALYEYFSNNDCDLSGLKYSVFGLGNKTYEHYNEVGKFFDKKLEQLSAERISDLGLADDDGNLEEDFMRWREAFLPTIAQKFDWELTKNGQSDRQYRLEILTDPPTNIFNGELSRIGSYERQRPPFDQKNPYLAKIVINRELHLEKSERSCRHVEFEVDGSKVRYEAGDHVAIFPTNDADLVGRIGRALDVDLDVIFKLINVDEESSKRNPFPCPCTYRTALIHYVDISSPVKSHVLKALSDYTSDEQAKAKLLLLSTASEEGLKEYSQFVQKERRNILDILDQFPSCKPPIDLLLELLPRLQARYYSISSSSKPDNNRISVTAVVLKYQIDTRTIKGVCTNYLARLPAVSSSSPIFVRKSTLRLPYKLQTPVIMVGPGTGFAPFRGFLQERLWQKKNQGKEIGEMFLFFGCRHPEHDYIYKEELEHFVESQILTSFQVAFSRLQSFKIYVQDKIWESRERLWSSIENGAYIYVCGDARNMARDVQNVFLKIFQEVGGHSSESAQKMVKEFERQRRYQVDVWS